MSTGETRNRYANLPRALAARLRAAERRLALFGAATVVLGSVAALGASLLLVFASDRAWDTPESTRAFLLGAGLLPGLVLFGRWLWTTVRHRRDPCATAELVQRRFRALGDSLQGAIELSRESSRPDDVSPELCRAAIEQVSEQSSALDFRLAVPSRPVRRATLLASGLMLALIGLAFLDGLAAANALRRWLRPFDDLDRYTFAQFDVLPDHLLVPYGEEFELPVRIADQSRWVPGSLSYRFEGGMLNSMSLDARETVLRLPGQTAPALLSLRAGDATAQIPVRPVHRPVLLRVLASVEYPDYLGRAREERVVGQHTLEVVEGSSVRFRALASNPIRRAAAQLGSGPGLAVGARDRWLSSEPLTVTVGESLTFEWEDVYGLAPSRPYEIEIKPRADAPPFVVFPDLAPAVAIIEDETLPLAVRADDDFGVRGVSVCWAWQDIDADSATATRDCSDLADGSPTAEIVDAQFRLSPAVLGIPAHSVVRLRAEARDFFPKREPVPSREHIVYVLSHAEHAKLVQERFDAVRDRVEEVTNREEELLSRNAELEGLPAGTLAEEETTGEIEKQEGNELENAVDLDAAVRSGMELLKEALRNTDFSPSEVQEWAEMLSQLDEIAKAGMPEVARSLGGAAGQPGQRSERLMAATDAQRKILDALRGLNEKFGKTLQDMKIRNMANRLREASRSEDTIASQLRAALPHVVGAVLDDLSARWRFAIGDAGRLQTRTRDSVERVERELDGFFARTQVPKYNVVYQQMREAKVVDRLSELSETIRENRTVLAISGTTEWSKRLGDWADMLDGGQSDGGQGGGGAQGEMSQELITLLLTFMRLVQEETALRDDTWSAEQRRQHDSYAEVATRLSGKQAVLLDELRDIDPDFKFPELNNLLGEADFAMEEARVLLERPQTDDETVAAENMVIELLSSCLSCTSGRMGASSGLMAGLMSAMGMGSGGGSMAGGDAAGPAEDIGGETEGGLPAGRGHERASGRDLSGFPPEFRDMLEAYFRKVEAIRK